ncbi:MAG: phosphoribosylformylglycinamidine synthase subunit PurS [Pyrinomonadaceae bacterium]|nr:phosphoribosylformylglycinamidine synthase subunit PurS [Pyrinomonadaceae bacterium]
MLAKVYVTLKEGVLDPQGSAIQHSVELMGIEGNSAIRQGKYFEIAFNEDVSREEASSTAERIAKDVLANPVIEDYRVELVTSK